MKKAIALLLIAALCVGMIGIMGSCEEPKSDSDTVYITETGSKFHKWGCQYLGDSAIPISRGEAIEKGYTPCSVCKP